MKSSLSVKLVSVVVGLCVMVFVSFCAFESTRLNTQYSVKEFFPKHHHTLEDGKLTTQRFLLTESPAFFLSISLNKQEKGTWLQPKRVAELDAATNAVGALANVKSVRSLSNLDMAIESGSTLQVGPIFKSLPPAKWASTIQSNALIRSQLISKDFRSVLLVVEPSDHSSAGLLNLEKELRTTVEGLNSKRTVDVGGVPAVQANLSEKVQSEVGKFLLLSLVLFCFMFVLFYRNFSPVVFAACGLIVTNITCLGLLSALGVSFTVLLSTLPMIVSIAFVSLAIHTLHLTADRMAAAGSPRDLTQRWNVSIAALKELALPNFLGSLTTAIGFVVLAFATIPAIRNYAFVISGAVMWTWFVSQVLLFGFQHFINPVPRKWNQTRAWWMLRVNRFSIPIVAVTVAMSLVLGSAFMKLNFSGRLFDDLPEKEPVRQATIRLDQSFGGTVAYDVALESQNPDAWKDPARLRRLKKALNDIRRIEGVGSAVSVTDFFGTRIPKSKAGVAETYFLFSMAEENPLRNFLSQDEKEVRIAARLRDLPSNAVATIRSEVRSVLQSIDPSLRIRESGLAVNSHTLNQEVAKQLVFGFWHSLLIIGLLLVVIFKSVRWALMACLPNLIPPAVLIGSLAIFQTPIKPGIALIFSIALGLAFNNTVYLLTRLKRIQDERGMGKLPLRRAFLEEGNPCFNESFIMFVGFLIFLASDFKLNQTFGIYMLLSIVAGALGDLIFLPAVLRQFSDFLWAKNSLEFVETKTEAQVIAFPKTAATFVEDQKDDSAEKPAIAAAWLAAVITVGILFTPFQAGADDVKELLDKARKQLESKTDAARVQLKIIEPNGETKTREMTLQTMRGEASFKALVRIQSPADIKGTALLAEVEKGEERQWLYLPSNKQVRRVASAQKSSGVLGSELSPEDLNPEMVKNSKTKMLSKNAQFAVLETTPAKGTSEYTKILTTFALPQSLPVKTEYYVGPKVKKTVEFLGYKQVDGKVFRAQTIRVKNLLKNRGTDVVLSDFKVNSGLTAKDFTQAALKDSW